MNAPSLILALVLASAGTASLYLASPHQRWRAAPLAARPARIVGAVLLAASLGAFLRAMLFTAAIYSFVAWAMLLFTLAPYLGAARKIGPR